jgi:hypothetical protein
VAEERALESVMTKLYNFEQLTLAERSELRRIITASDRAVTQEEISDLFVVCVGVGRLGHLRSSKTLQRKIHAVVGKNGWSRSSHSNAKSLEPLPAMVPYPREGLSGESTRCLFPSSL